jgi:hypothetical protein
MTQHPPHTVASELLDAELARIIPSARYHIRSAKPVRLPNQDSEPEPDLCVARGSIRDYEGGYPGPGHIWIVNLVQRQVEVYTDPGPGGYLLFEVYAEGKSVPVVIDRQPLGQIAVEDILPSRQADPQVEDNGDRQVLM